MPEEAKEPALGDIQAMMRASILTGNTDPRLEAVINPDGLSAGARIQIHSNNYRLNMKAVLESVFPLVRNYVGEEFFAGLAGEYVRSSPPDVPVLSRYGAGFAGFVRTFEHTEDMAWLADVAALEWAIHESAQSLDSLCTATGNRKMLNPGLRLVRSRWPLLMLWMAGQGQVSPEAVDMDAGGQNILVVRRGGAVKLHVLDDDQAQLVEGLLKGSGQVGVDADLVKLSEEICKLLFETQ